MKTNDRCRRTRALCLLLTVTLWAVSGCQTQLAREPTPTTSPEPPTVTVEQPTEEPTSLSSPESPTATIEQEPSAQEPTTTELRTFPRVTVEEVQQWMDAGEPLFFIDARSADAWSTATTKAPGALRVPPHEDIEPYLDRIPQNQRVVIYCT